MTHTVKGTTCTRQEVDTLLNYLKKEENHTKKFERFRECQKAASSQTFSSVCSSEQRKGQPLWYLTLKLFSPIKRNAEQL